jgi:hypothetical protein
MKVSELLEKIETKSDDVETQVDQPSEKEPKEPKFKDDHPSSKKPSTQSLPWAENSNRDMIDMVINTVGDHPRVWLDAMSRTRDARGYSELWATAYKNILEVIGRRRLDSSLNQIKLAIAGGEGVKKHGFEDLAIGAAAAMLAYDDKNPRSFKFPSTAASALGLPLNQYLQEIQRGDELCVLMYPSKLVYEKIKEIEKDQIIQRIDGPAPTATVDKKLDRRLSLCRNGDTIINEPIESDDP